MSKQIKIANVTIITDAAKLNDTIADVARKGKTLDNLIHRAGVSCMYHAREHGDVTKMVGLIQAMPKASRRKALVAWIEAHMPVDEVKDNATETTIKLTKGRKADDFLLADAAATPFWDFTQERAPVAMTVERAIKAFENALKKAVEQGNATESDVAALENAVSATLAANDSSTVSEADAGAAYAKDASAAA